MYNHSNEDNIEVNEDGVEANEDDVEANEDNMEVNQDNVEMNTDHNVWTVRIQEYYLIAHIDTTISFTFAQMSI